MKLRVWCRSAALFAALVLSLGVAVGSIHASPHAQAKDASSKAMTWGPYKYALLIPGDDLTPDATMSVIETLTFADGVLTITEERKAGSADPSRVNGLGTNRHTCKAPSVHASGTKTDDGNGNSYIPSPLWQVQLGCAEGSAAAMFLSEKDATAFAQSINDAITQ